MTRALEAWTWVLMRVTSGVLAIAVFVHLGTIIYAVHGGLSAREILARLHGNVGWHVFYVVFVLAAAIHAAIGLRNVVREHTPWCGRSLGMASVAVAAGLGWMGLRALAGFF